MKRVFSLLLPLIFLFVMNCASSDSQRKLVSASGDPEEIFFEKEKSTPTPASKQTPVEDPQLGLLNQKQADPSLSQYDEVGYASYYSQKFHGKPTASGEVYDKNRLTGSHKTLPLGSMVRVTNLGNKKEVVVRINDRGPYVDGRIMDLSEKAAEQLEFKDAGIAKVGVKILRKGDEAPKKMAQTKEDWEADADNLVDLASEKKKETLAKSTDELKSKSKLAKTKSLSPKGYSIQVGVFKEEARAIKYKETVSNDYGETGYIVPREDSYVVFVGDFEARTQAEELKKKMRNDGIDCFIPKK
jgi:rare lipoprotein A